MFPNLRRTSNSGFIFLEVVLSAAFIVIALVTLLGITALASTVSASLRQDAQASVLLSEEIEAVRSFRGGTTWATNGLGTLATGSSNPYYASQDTVPNPPAWKLNSGTETTGVFTRNVVFNRVSRDPSTGNIESPYNGSHDDSDTRQITVTVAGGGKTYQAVTYFTNWK